jgi:hypothetical protein
VERNWLHLRIDYIHTRCDLLMAAAAHKGRNRQLPCNDEGSENLNTVGRHWDLSSGPESRTGEAKALSRTEVPPYRV